MAKSKSAQANTAAKLSNNEVKSLSSVRHGAVTKSSQTPKAKSKEMAKQAMKAASKKSKKVKEPTPEVDSDDSEESDDDSASSASSDDSESEAEAPKTNGSKTNGVSKAEPKGEAETSESSASSDESASDSDDSDESEDDMGAAAVSKKIETTAANANNVDSEDESEDDSEDDDGKPNGAVGAKAINGNVEKSTIKSEDSEEDSEEDSDVSGASDDSDDSDSSDETDESEEKPAPKNKKRKAETETAPAAKKSKNAAADGLDDATKKNLFVGHLSYNVDEEWMTREFEGYGTLTRVVHIVDRESQRPKGFGYVEFENAEDGVRAQEAMNGKEIDGRAINVDFSRPKTEQQPRQDRAKQYGDKPLSPPSATIFVANLAFSATSDNVGEEFGKHADVVGVRLPTDRETGEPKGFGYVEFVSIEEAQKAFAGMEGQSIMGRVPRLDYSSPRPDRGDSAGGRGGFGRGGGRGGFDRGGRGGGRGRGGFDRGGRGGGRGGRGGSTNRGGFGDFQGKKMSFA